MADCCMERVKDLLANDALLKLSDVAFSCSSGGRGVHVNAWNVSNGAILRTYRSDCDGKGDHLCMAGLNYLLCSLKNKPFILVWDIDKEPVHLKIACIGLVSAMACHPSGYYCVAAIGEKINIWELSSGHLLAQQTRHYQPVGVLQFTKDGAHFFSGGRDCLVITWNLGSVLSDSRVCHFKQHSSAPPLLQWRGDGQRGSGASLTRHVWSDHSLAVTALHTECSGVCGRVLTASLDHSCKMYDFATGSLLCTFLFDFPPMAVQLHPSTDWIIVGGKTGVVAMIPLFLPTQKQVFQISKEGGNPFISLLHEHKGPITGLASSGSQLISASEDKTCRVWDLSSRQSVNVVTLKGDVTGLLTHSDVWGLVNCSVSKSRKKIPLSAFKKQLYYTTAEGRGWEEEQGRAVNMVASNRVHPLQVNVIDVLDRLCGDIVDDQTCSVSQLKRHCFQGKTDELCERDVKKMRQELKELKDVHKKMFSYTTKKLLKS